MAWHGMAWHGMAQHPKACHFNQVLFVTLTKSHKFSYGIDFHKLLLFFQRAMLNKSFCGILVCHVIDLDLDQSIINVRKVFYI